MSITPEQEKLLAEKQRELDEMESRVMDTAYRVAMKRRTYPDLIMQLFEQHKINRIAAIDEKVEAAEPGPQKKNALNERVEVMQALKKEKAELLKNVEERKKKTDAITTHAELLYESMTNPLTAPVLPEADHISRLTVRDCPFLA